MNLTPETTWLREQIVAAVRSHGVATTAAVTAQLPPEHIAQPCPAHNPLGCRRRLPDFRCADGVHTFTAPRECRHVYNQLRALEDQGVVTRVSFGDYSSRAVWWMLVDADNAADEIDALNDLYAAS